MFGRAHRELRFSSGVIIRRLRDYHINADPPPSSAPAPKSRNKRPRGLRNLCGCSGSSLFGQQLRDGWRLDTRCFSSATFSAAKLRDRDGWPGPHRAKHLAIDTTVPFLSIRATPPANVSSQGFICPSFYDFKTFFSTPFDSSETDSFFFIRFIEVLTIKSDSATRFRDRYFGSNFGTKRPCVFHRIRYFQWLINGRSLHSLVKFWTLSFLQPTSGLKILKKKENTMEGEPKIQKKWRRKFHCN